MLFNFSSGVVSVVSKRALGVMESLNKKRSLHVGLGGGGWGMECAFLSLSVEFQLINKLTTDSWKLALLIQILKFYFNIHGWIHMYVCVYVDVFFIYLVRGNNHPCN